MKIIFDIPAYYTADPYNRVEVTFTLGQREGFATYGHCFSWEINRLIRKSKKESPLQILRKDLKSQDVKRRRFAEWALENIDDEVRCQAGIGLQGLSGVRNWLE